MGSRHYMVDGTAEFERLCDDAEARDAAAEARFEREQEFALALEAEHKEEFFEFLRKYGDPRLLNLDAIAWGAFDSIAQDILSGQTGTWELGRFYTKSGNPEVFTIYTPRVKVPT